MEIVLASKSPRRQELLRRIVDNFKIIESNFDEDSIKFNGDIEEYVKSLAMGKALNVKRDIENKSLIIGVDTVVFYDNKILGKPKNYDDAYSMLSALSGNTHKVYSGVCIFDTEKLESKSFVCETKVKFSKINKSQIEKYIMSKEPMDKAGAYGIQGLGGVFVEKIEGCYYNVMGLPLNKLNKELSSYNITNL
ncbi:MAG: Maf-like protein [Clostridium perfringens]|nr:Maf-like protein [Clostridium perfringens]